MLHLSEKYLFEKLNGACQEFLKKEICTENAITMLEVGLQSQANDLVDECWKLIDMRTKEAIESSSSVAISKKTMELLLARDSLNIKEIELFHYLIRWAKAKEANDWKILVQPFLNYIRFPLMSSKELIREVKPSQIIMDTDPMYIEALEFNADTESFHNLQKKQFISRKGSFKQLEDDIFLPGPNYVLSNKYKVATKTRVSNSWDTNIITNAVNKGIHRWSLRIVFTQYSHIKIGVAPHSIDQTQLDNSKKSGWYFYLYDGTLFSGPPLSYSGQAFYNTTGRLGNGTIVDVELDMNKGSIRYFINGVDCGIAFQEGNIPTSQPLRLAVILVYTNDSIELLSHTYRH